MPQVREIEVKATLSNPQKVIATLEKWGCTLSEPIIQRDRVFVAADSPFPAVPKGANVLRLREQHGKVIFTLKQPQSNELDCIEYETTIGDSEQMENIIKMLNFKKVVEIHKVRRKTRYQTYEICIDEVKDLGSFIEVEVMSDDDAKTVQEQLFIFLQSLGVNPENRVTKGYDTLLYEKNKNI